MTEIDWESLQTEAKNVLIPAGNYNVAVKTAEAVTSAKGKPMVKLDLVILDGKFKNRVLKTQIVLSAESPFALQRWFANLAAFGLDADYFKNRKSSMEAIANELVNRGVLATVDDTHEYQGSLRNQITGYAPFVPFGPPPAGVIIGAAAPAGTSGPAVAAPQADGPPPAADSGPKLPF